MESYIVGEQVCQPCADTVYFDMTASGGLLVIKWNKPSAKEKRAFKDRTSFHFVVVDEVIMILCRLGTTQWMDAPYYRLRSTDELNLELPHEGYGLGIHALLIDASTGILVAQKLFSIDTDTTRGLFYAISQQPVIMDFDERVQRIMARYKTTDLVRLWEEANNG